MTVAMLIIGLLFGFALAVTVALFGVLSMDGRFGENILAASREIRGRLTGRRPKAQPIASGRSAESEARIRSLQDEVRVMQKLLDQARTERETHAGESKKAGEEIATLRAAVAERDERLKSGEAEVSEAQSAVGKLRDELAQTAAALARSRGEIKDLETELSIASSGAGLSAVSDEIARLTAERDELSARLQRMSRPVAAVK